MHIEADRRYQKICSAWPGLRVHFPSDEHEEHDLRLVFGAVNTHVPYTSKRLIALDFDGTCVTHAYPVIGDRVPGFVEVMEAVKKASHAVVLVLNTVRCGLHLIEALDWLAQFADRIPPLAAVNLNPDQSGWNNSTKIYAPHLHRRRRPRRPLDAFVARRRGRPPLLELAAGQVSPGAAPWCRTGGTMGAVQRRQVGAFRHGQAV